MPSWNTLIAGLLASNRQFCEQNRKVIEKVEVLFHLLKCLVIETNYNFSFHSKKAASGHVKSMQVVTNILQKLASFKKWDKISVSLI